MKKILVPFDFSETATNALRFAIDVANQSNGEILLLHIVELPVMYDTLLMPSLSFEEVYIKDMKENAEKEFKKVKAKWAKDGPKLNWHIDFGATSATINNFAKTKKADLIVMGTKGATGLQEVMVGSNTERVVRTSSIPVIAIKKNFKGIIKSIVFPNSLNEEAEELAKKIKALQDFFKAKLHIVYINTPANFMRDIETHQLLNGFVKRYMFKDFEIHIYNDLDQETGLTNFVKEVKGDMVAMGTHGRRGLAHLMSGSIAEDVVNHIECPIWTFKTK
jgi:nucleotide-binding universal stress UspA family protein